MLWALEFRNQPSLGYDGFGPRLLEVKYVWACLGSRGKGGMLVVEKVLHDSRFALLQFTWFGDPHAASCRSNVVGWSFCSRRMISSFGGKPEISESFLLNHVEIDAVPLIWQF